VLTVADRDNLFVHPAVERMALRRRMADAAEGLLEAAHAIIAELGRDAPDADLEPSLGAPESSRGQVFDWASGGTDDREDAQDELESSLGSSRALNQATWGAGSCSDLEHEHDGREPTCEDEGAQCEDEGGEHDGREIEPGDGVPTYHPEDQRKLLGTVFDGQSIYTDVG
jgi:hypothetical protein